MADIRINALANTATSAASDDYLALDGSANGTRKILATNVAQNVTDVTFGSSGPSAKSSIAARASRQGLVFDGTAGATISVTIGSGDFTAAAWVSPTNFSTYRDIFGGAANSFELAVDTDATLISVLSNVAGNTKSTGTLTANKAAMVAYVRSGSTGTYYINGVAAGTTTDSRNYSVATTLIGAGLSGSNYQWLGSILSPLIENRALSAAEVVALYEAGVPAGADYNNAGTTDIKPSAGTYAYWFGTGSISSATASSFTIAAGASSLAVRNVSGTFSAVSGRRYRATIVASGLNSAADFGSQGFTSSLSAGNVSNGTNVIEFTATSTASGYFAISSISSTAGGSISISSIVALGLLLAPDAGQAGGGLTWYDTSGNAANITLSASGVTWNVPTSSKVATGWSFGNTTSTSSTSPIRISTGGTYGTTFANGFKSLVYEDTSGNLAGVGITGSGVYLGSSYSNSVIFVVSGSEISRFTNSGNLLLKSDGVDSSNGKLQLATHTTSAGGIGFGTASSLYIAGSGDFRFVSGGIEGAITLLSGGTYVGSVTSGKSTYLVSGAGTTALTLDSSQNATFAGTVKPKASTGTAVFALDTNGQTMTIANGATANPFSNADTFSGIFVVNDTSNTGQAAVFLAAGGNMILISQTAASFSNAVGTAGKTNVYLVGGSVVTIQNNSGTNTNYNITAIRTRNQQ